jgi:hypothetical protein
MRRNARWAAGLATVGLLSTPHLPFACTPPPACPTGTVVLTMDNVRQFEVLIARGTDSTVFAVEVFGRVVNTSTATITWTGTYPIGEVDGSRAMIFPDPDPTTSPPTPMPPIPPIATKTAKVFALIGGFPASKGAPAASHAVAVGITNMHWVDPKFAGCAPPAGSIVVRTLPPVAY